jgi:predicted AAA+ superfamily ATPase
MAEAITDAEVFGLIRKALAESVIKAMESSYNSPVSKLIESCINRHKAELEALVDQLITSTLGSMEFRDDILHAFKDKVARVLVSKADGAIEKTVNEYRQNPVFRAKLTLAIEQLIAEHSGK